MARSYATGINHEYIGKSDLDDSICSDAGDLHITDWHILSEHEIKHGSVMVYLQDRI